MPKIHTLSPEIVSKTAAGEVVERPASVIKELLENSLDANSTKIITEVEESGFKKILVIDDGEGMDKDDVFECIKPHTTSKILCEEDLIGIKSLGFRGEALNSISSVSKVTIKSRAIDQQSGTLIEVHGGKVIKNGAIGIPAGTQIEITDLFYNTPARKKFLKSSATEFRHILDIVINTALANPTVAFQLKHNKKIVMDLPKAQSIDERIQALLGVNTY
jgi:DNA mismatch repair protein MutL